MLWGAFAAKLIDRKLKQASIYLLITAVFTFFGVIHSANPDGNMYFPWQLTGAFQQVPYQFTVAYLVLAGMLFLLSYTKQSKEIVSIIE